MSICFLNGCINKNIEIENTKKFKFSYSVGNYMYSDYCYELELNSEDKYIISYKPVGISDENKFQKEITKEQVLELEEILKRNKISKWNGFKKADKNVLDGYSFDLHYRKQNDENIDASGYMKYPKGYKEFKNDIINFYTNIFKDEIKNQKEEIQ